MKDGISGQYVQDVHVYYGERIDISDKNGVVLLQPESKNRPIDVTFSHLSYEQEQRKVFCGDTIALNSTFLSVPEISIVSKIPTKDLRQFYRNLRKSLINLAEFEGHGIAENSVHHHNRIGEYKSFIFNHQQEHGGISDVTCINAYQHIKSDTIRYFENIHRLLECIQLSYKKRDYQSLLHDFLFDRNSWKFELKGNIADGRTFYKFKRDDEEVMIEFEDNEVREIALINPKVLVERVERNGVVSENAQVSLKITIGARSDDKLNIKALTATIDIESGLLMTAVNAEFEDADPYRESIVSAMQNLGDEYLIYLMLDIEDPLVELTNCKLSNKNQIVEFISSTAALTTEDLLNRFGVIVMSDTSKIDTSLQFGDPILVRHDGATFIREYFDIQPLIAMHAVVYENHKTNAIEVKLILDPSSTQLIQFEYSQYNEKWKSYQLGTIKSVAARLSQYLSSSGFDNIRPSELNTMEWEKIEQDLEAVIARYLRTSLNQTFRSFKSGQFQTRRLDIEYH